MCMAHAHTQVHHADMSQFNKQCCSGKIVDHKGVWVPPNYTTYVYI